VLLPYIRSAESVVFVTHNIFLDLTSTVHTYQNTTCEQVNNKNTHPSLHKNMLPKNPQQMNVKGFSTVGITISLLCKAFSTKTTVQR